MLQQLAEKKASDGFSPRETIEQANSSEGRSMNEQTNGTSSVFQLSLDEASKTLLERAAILISQAENLASDQSENIGAEHSSGTWKDIENIISF